MMSRKQKLQEEKSSVSLKKAESVETQVDLLQINVQKQTAVNVLKYISYVPIWLHPLKAT